ncbi:MAG: signal peptidase I [Candidatus Acidiferrales bacterium]
MRIEKSADRKLQRNLPYPEVAPECQVPRDSADNGPKEVAGILSAKGWAFLKVSGKSMLPWIRPGDVVFLRKAKIEEIERGDVVVFESNGSLCVHRMIAPCCSGAEQEKRFGLVTKGDCVAEADEPIFAEEFRGKVAFIYRNGKERALDAGWRKMLGKVIALLSPRNGWWLPLLRALGNARSRLGDASIPESQETAELGLVQTQTVKANGAKT